MNVDLIYRFLRLNDTFVSHLKIAAIYESHPMPHSIRSISDTLDELSIPHMVCKISQETIMSVDEPVIIVINKQHNPFFIVSKIDKKDKTIYLSDAKGNCNVISYDDFIRIWDGIILILDDDRQQYIDNRIYFYVKEVIYYVSKKYMLVLVSVLLLLTLFTINNYMHLCLLILLILGMFISHIIVQQEQNISNTLKSACNINSSFNCAVKSYDAKSNLLNWTTMGELSLTYFTSTLTFAFLGYELGLSSIVFSTLFIIPIICYSIGYQFFKKKWCLLCISIDIILVCTVAIALINIVKVINYEYIILSTISYILLVVLVMLTTTKLIKILRANRQTEIDYSLHEHLLISSDTFWTLVNNSFVYDFNGVKMISNGVESNSKLTIILNPFCKHCANHIKFLGKFSGININLLMITDNSNKTAYEIALKLISYAQYYDWNSTIECLNRWYVDGEIPTIEISNDAKVCFQRNMDFCVRSKIQRTPLVFINDKILPDIYTIEDIQYML